MRSVFRGHWVATAFVAALIVVAGVSNAAAQKAKLTFLHLNDVYEISPKQGIGGFAPLMTLLRQERARAPEAITTLGGDLVGSSMMSGITKGAQMIELTNAIGLDVAVVGNHELDFGIEVFKQRMAESRYPWLATNMTAPDGVLFPNTHASHIRKVGEITIGFFGLITPETEHLSNTGATVKYLPVLETARTMVKQLRDQGADVIVALTHVSLADDRALAKQVKGIDIILGGHDHDPMMIYEGGVFIFKAGYDAHYLGVAEFDVDKQKTERGTRVTVRPTTWRYLTTASVAPDPEIAAIVKKHDDKLDADLKVPVGKIAVELDSRRATVRQREAAIGNLIADAIRDFVKADVAITNGGGIRGDRTYEPGTTLTRKDVLTELPFGNITVLIELSGAELRQALEEGVSQVEDRAGRFPHVSGMRFTFDAKRPKGARVLEVAVAGVPLDAGAKYRVATNDYMFEGGDGYATLTKGKAIVDKSAGTLMASVVMDYIAQRGEVAPMVEGRIVERQ
ncbi:MAG TPA: bifunctional UDP-sugar hydrolase/5'-nucleotidase [Alphaproteobacteria bacterium]|nr:bifunctional UDP-sugar hydrolase/5'-nucleotidase [Alphaproteobacteria bacterium]